tara:strand:- start:2264 stop:4090 length:1827 start_codon:yes stop_codon:yes gene_type:complete
MKSKLRKSQLLTSFGVGAIVEIDDQSLIGMDISEWPSGVTSKKFRIDSIPRLQKILKKQYFISPPAASSEIYDTGNDKYSLPYRRFPGWLECRKCGSLRNYRNLHNIKFENLKCLKCKAKSKFLSPIRFIYSGDNGYLNDIWWNGLLHSGETSGCTSDELTKKTIPGRGGGLFAIEISCDSCGVKKNLQEIKGLIRLQQPIACQPWQEVRGAKVENKNHQPFQQRSATSLYQPLIASALDLSGSKYEDDLVEDLDEYLSDHDSIIEARHTLAQFKKLGIKDKDAEKKLITNAAEKINRNKPHDMEEISVEAVSKVITQDLEEIAPEEEVNLYDINLESLKISEYQLLSEKGRQKFKNYDGERYEVSDKSLSKYISSITKIRRLREVRVLTGYTRHFYPTIHSVNSSNKVYSWLPGYEVYGEGIFINFNKKSIGDWVKKNSKSINERLQRMQERQEETASNLPYPSARFVLLHTFSHLLIKQLCFESGYDSASIKEKLYVEEGSNDMAGVLIYTADGDTEGSLGGLVRMGDEERLMHSVESMLNSAKWCSSDPTCMEIGSPGTRGLNNAACHACALISETSCAYMNALLDRALVVGSEKIGINGFFDLT